MIKTVIDIYYNYGSLFVLMLTNQRLSLILITVELTELIDRFIRSPSRGWKGLCPISFCFNIVVQNQTRLMPVEVQIMMTIIRLYD